MTAVETSVQLLTTTLVQTVTVGASSVTAEAVAIPTSSDSIELGSRNRRAGTLASQSQIVDACADRANIIQNPNFAVGDDGGVPGWAVDANDPSVTVGSEPAPAGNGSIAQFKSAIVGRTLAISQPLVLCSDQQYEISALTRQAHKEAGCTVQLSVGNKNITTVTPQETWLATSKFFTAGAGVAGASVDLTITVSCKGYYGIPVADEEGWMRVEVSGVSIVQQPDSQQAKKRGVAEKQIAEEQGFGTFVWAKE